jgi:hypothetical protein
VHVALLARQARRALSVFSPLTKNSFEILSVDAEHTGGRVLVFS